LWGEVTKIIEEVHLKLEKNWFQRVRTSEPSKKKWAKDKNRNRHWRNVLGQTDILYPISNQESSKLGVLHCLPI